LCPQNTTGLEDLILAQEYRMNLWPTQKATDQLELKQHLILHFAHERPETDASQGLTLSILPTEGEQDLPPVA